MGLVIVPLKKDKLDAWKTWAESLNNEQSEEFNSFNKKYGLTRHDAWLAETPEGPVVVALHEGPGAESFMQEVGKSNDSFEASFKEKLMEFHGMDLSGPPPGPMPVKMI
ncbi:hypothetical protein [Maribellus sediminis]|uniref:hypothetical protein n=1 Tax=Maribellus sediminis TaxID=2696285 RepID=UPI001430CF9E|nr:hypothetical protein [Maribellus sediminis]